MDKDNIDVGEKDKDNIYDSLPSEPPDIGNWFSSYVYESPPCCFSQLPEPPDYQSHQLTTLEDDQLIIDDSDTEGENSTFIFRKPMETPKRKAPQSSGCCSTSSSFTHDSDLAQTLKEKDDRITALEKKLNDEIAENARRAKEMEQFMAEMRRRFPNP